MQFNELFTFMKKLMIVTMVVLSITAMATCLFCKDHGCAKEARENTPSLNIDNIECDETFCTKDKKNEN